MSLIQQALKRKLDEQHGTAAPPPPPLAAAPLATPPPPNSPLISGGAAMTPPSSGSKISIAHPVARAEPPATLPQNAVAEVAEPKRSSALVAVVILILLLAAGAAVWYFQFRNHPDSVAVAPANSAKVKTIPTGATPATAPSATKNVPDKKYTQVPSAIPLPNIGAVHEKVDKMKEGINEFRKEGSEVTGVPPPLAPPKVEPAPVVAVPKPDPVIVAPAPAPAPATPAPAAVPVTWPAVKITGVMATSQKDHRTAFINDSLVNIGDTVDGMILIDVAENSVTLEFKGERRQISVGRRH